MKKTHYIILIAVIAAFWFVFSLSQISSVQATTDLSEFENNLENNIKKKHESSSPQSYKRLLELGLKPELDPSYAFPIDKQFRNGCFGYSIKWVVEYKYWENLDMYEMEIAINKPRSDLWNIKHIENFWKRAGVEYLRYNNADTMLSKLHQGEPILLFYLMPHKWWQIGHNAVAYSFDEKWIRIADPLLATRERIPYDQILEKNGKYSQYSFWIVKKL